MMKVVTASFAVSGPDTVVLEGCDGIVAQIKYDYVGGVSVSATIADQTGVDLLRGVGPITATTDAIYAGPDLKWPPVAGEIIVDRSGGGSLNAFNVTIWIID